MVQIDPACAFKTFCDLHSQCTKLIQDNAIELIFEHLQKMHDLSDQMAYEGHKICSKTNLIEVSNEFVKLIWKSSRTAQLETLELYKQMLLAPWVMHSKVQRIWRSQFENFRYSHRYENKKN